MEPLAGRATSIADLFRLRAQASSSAEAYRYKVDGRWVSTTWAEFESQVGAMATTLKSVGICHGEAVAILGETCPAWCIADLAAIVLGGHSVGIYQTLLLDQVQFILEDSRSRVLCVQGRDQYERVRPLLETLPELKALVVWDYDPPEASNVFSLARCLSEEGDRSMPVVEVMGTDTALIVYTSGTTGQPKGVPLTHENLLAHLRSGEAFLPELITPEDITLSFLPMAHVAEHVPGFMGRLNLGLTTAFASSYETLLDELKEVRPTYFGAVPRIFEKMYGRIREEVAQKNARRQVIFRWAERLARKKARWDMGGPAFSLWERLMYRLADALIYRRIRDVFGGRVKTFLTGAAPMNLEILEFFHGMGMTILEVYGLSETTAIAFANVPGCIRHGTVGRALPGVEVKLADDGEVLLKGPIVFSGYLNLDNLETYDEDGFFRTGDVGILDEDGFLTLTDRKKNLLKTAGGKYVAPSRLEALVKEDALISQVYIHGDREKYIVALVTLDELEMVRAATALGTAVDALAEHPVIQERISAAISRANDRLARFEQIKHHRVIAEDFSVEQGTLTPTLKVKRREVARIYGDVISSMYA